jgi:hypothetical protein
LAIPLLIAFSLALYIVTTGSEDETVPMALKKPKSLSKPGP